MKLLIEKYKYEDHSPGSTVYKALHGSGLVSELELQDKNPISLDYVGYLYNRECDDVVFILPKVVLTGGKDSADQTKYETVFGISPEELIDFDNSKEKNDPEIKNFLSELAIWIYRAICVYRDHTPDSQILQSAEYSNNHKGRKASKFYTLFDVVLALRDFNKEHQNYLTFIAKYNHSGQNKINWNKTISKSDAIIQDDVPIYVDLINKKKDINFDEELLIIYYSILYHIKEHYGFKLIINFNYPLITGSAFKALCERRKGLRRLKAIKYKYYSDVSLKLWNLCYAFFDQCHDISIKRKTYDYLLAKNFNIVFEKMIDELLGDNIDEHGLKSQRDSKRVDHMFIYDSLIWAEKDHPSKSTYYIGDSKYYNRRELDEIRIRDEQAKVTGIRLDDTSKYKQFTYARNVVQWNMDLFFKEPDSDHLRLRPDPLTEGYNVIPNFFISAYIPYEIEQGKSRKDLFDFKNDKLKSHDTIEINRHFNNRLFDRDTLLLSYYDINFLFVVSLYGRNSQHKQATWRDAVRKEFRKNVQKKLEKYYKFYKLTPLNDGWKGFIKRHFHYLHGKLFRPSEGSNNLILALQNASEKELNDMYSSIKDATQKKNLIDSEIEMIKEENSKILTNIRIYFKDEEMRLSDNKKIPT